VKELTCIRLINWHLFDDATITCHGTTYFVGANGAGKSTILDAVQFALVGGQRDVRYNQAALAGGKRTLAGYVRGELGSESRRFLRDDASGVVALEFRNSDGSSFVHGAVIDAYADGRSPDVLYFLVHGASLDDAWFFKARGQVFDSRAFKRHIEHFALPRGARAQAFTRVEDYRQHLLNRLGQLTDSFPAKIVKGLAFSPLTDIRAFVHNYLLDENLVDVAALQGQIDTLRHFESLATDVRERIAVLSAVEKSDEERVANRRLRIANSAVRRLAEAEGKRAALRERRLELQETRLHLERAALEREGYAAALARAQAQLLDAQVALQTDATALREQALRDRLAAAQAELTVLRTREAGARSGLAAEARDARRLAQWLAAGEQPVPPVLAEFAEMPNPAALPALQGELETLGHAYAAQAALLDEQVRQLRVEATQLDREIATLRRGDRETGYEAEAPQAARLRRRLCAELRLADDEAFFLCTALDVPDESWQDAVEGLLGASRFNLIVPPAHYAAAQELYRRYREQDGLHGVGLIDAERIARHARPAARDTLATQVRSAHPAARAYVDLLLGRYVQCATLDELREQTAGVTRECFVRRHFTTSHLNPQVYRRWFIGARALPRQIEQREARLETIAAELAGLNPQAGALRERLTLTRDKARALMALEHEWRGLERLPELAAFEQAVRAELDALDTRDVAAVRAAIAQGAVEVAGLQAALREIDRRSGAWEQQAHALEHDDLPALEQALVQIDRDLEAFLAAEAGERAGEVRAESEQECRRRCERAPIDEVIARATRYESDYQGAELRNRDRLREAKHAYSLRYEFDYDEDDGAARYAREREKFVQSELPQYETRIAEQRALAEQELVENFIHRLREQIEDARAQLAHLNGTLAALRFGGERYEFISHPAPALRQVYDMIVDSQTVLGDALLESGFRQKHQAGWDLLFERLTARVGDAPVAELRELQDYRNYLDYDIRIHYPNGDRALLSQINAKKSGGETTTPFYVAMAASFAQAYRLNQPRVPDTIRLALFDEAFSKMDTARTASALQFMRETGLQVLLATPPDKAGALLTHVDALRTVIRKDHHAFVLEIDKAEVLREIEGAAPSP
jgi:uncharacterized protein YPO0396